MELKTLGAFAVGSVFYFLFCGALVINEVVGFWKVLSFYVILSTVFFVLNEWGG